MNKAEKLFKKVKPVFDNYQPRMEHIGQMPERGVRDVLDKKDWGYYQWSAALIKLLGPKQVVELGGAMGVWCVAVLSELPAISKLYSITLPEGGLEFSFIRQEYPNLVKVLGNDLDLNSWPRDCQLDRTDIWFIDSLHTRDHLTKELELYSPFFKKGAVLLFDDIKMPELWEIWVSLPHDRYDASVLHFSGFGICVV